MTDSFVPPPEFRTLLDRLLDGGPLTHVETSHLEQWLQIPEARRHYARLMMQESMMAPLLAEMPTVKNDRVEKRVPPRAPQRRLALKAAAAIALLVTGVILGRTAFPPAASTVSRELPQSAAEAAPARITGMIGVRWDTSAPDTHLAGYGPLPERRLVFETGLLELSYDSGVRATLEGPADFTITGADHGRLGYGKLVTHVPKGCEGFVIDYPHGHVLDLGTEFAMELSRDGALKLGVFDGEVELHLPDQPPRPLQRDQAVVHDRNAESPVRAVPFERNRFVRHLPSRDFPWTVDSEATCEVRFDVTHLIWRSAQYHAIFKWVDGVDAIEVRDVELRRDGKTVAAATGDAVAGFLHLTRDNRFVLDLEPADFRHSARWTVHAQVSPYEREGALTNLAAPISSLGILQFEEGLVASAGAADFIGRWAYHHAGVRFIREFHPNGSITFFKNGTLQPSAFKDCRWSVRDGVLHATQPDGGPDELHVLRDTRTLVFLNRPYQNAIRENPKY